MTTELYNDDSLFDRLVDGELTGLERRRLLESLDERADGWRRCALAFLEAQSLRDELRSVAHDSHRDSKAAAAQSEKMPASFERKIHDSQRVRGLQWLALAAGLLLAFGLGWLGHERGEHIATKRPIGNQQVAQIMPSPIGAGSTNPNNALTLFVRDNSGRNVPVRVPLVDADTLDRQFGTQFQPAMSEEIRNKLQREGYTVQSKRQYAPLWFENGSPMVVPVEDTKIVPVNNKVF
jgi:hypothetical protein